MFHRCPLLILSMVTYTGSPSNSAPAYASPSFHSLSLREQLPSIMTQQLSSSLDGALDESNIGTSLSQTKLKPKDDSTLSSRQLRTGSSSDRTLASSCALSVDEIRHSKAAASFLLPRPGVKRREYKKMHACQVCQKTFPRPSGLKTHMNTHDQIRPFRCTVDGCGKSFTVKSNCKRHLRTHGRNLEESSRRFEEYSNPSSSPDLPNSTPAPRTLRLTVIKLFAAE
ncbi:hypothetical protein DL96DRAFT_1708444 [Flagelloscypha sp. PMI_526]|nr:hypothetical protein DL96DRAFT_1708444 [Flagelloscypha sp. PMI_526]